MSALALRPPRLLKAVPDGGDHDVSPREHDRSGGRRGPARRSRRHTSELAALLRLGAASTIILVWVASFIASMLSVQVDPPPELGALATLAATYLLGSGLIRGRTDDDES